MRKTFLLFAMLMATLTVRAQYEEGDILIQPRVGITISNITDGDKSGGRLFIIRQIPLR